MYIFAEIECNEENLLQSISSFFSAAVEIALTGSSQYCHSGSK